MKNIFKSGFVLMTMVILLSGCAGNNMLAQSTTTTSVNYQSFYDDLSPFGTWIDYPGYGNVWHPSIDGDFRPYLTNGYWNYSDDGWLWMSNYSWGWAPFHYGRWVYDNMYGWLWVPGYEWSPAWVTWGTVDNYFAWAPLMPEVNAGNHYSNWRPASLYWNLCNKSDITDRDIYNKVEHKDIDRNYAARINIINNFNKTAIHGQFYAKGPEIDQVERYVTHKIEPVAVHDADKVSDVKHEGNMIKVYRPAVHNPQPREFRRIDDNTVNPVHRDEDKVATERKQQLENINRLPVSRSQENLYQEKPQIRERSNPGRKMRKN